MKSLKILGLALCASFFAVLSADAALNVKDENSERPAGIKIGRRMNLRPYVALSATYDSNVGSRSSDTEDDILWTVNPSLSLDYQGDNWSALLSGYYNYRAYCKDHSGTSEGNEHSYGESLRINWSNSAGADAGWSLLLMESFQQISQADDLSTADARGYNSDRQQVQFGVGLQRRFNEHWHADVNASYYYLDYMNTDNTVPAYGWQRWSAGAEAGFAPSQWTDFLIAGSYQGYSQDNADRSMSRIGRDVSRESQGYTLQGGIGSYATERISYRVLAGWSRFEYGDGGVSDDGFTYTVSGNWNITDTLSTMLMASSYYQPSEYEYASASRVDALSWGLAKSLVRSKLRATIDLTYRHETNEHADGLNQNADYEIDMVTARLGLHYTLTRFLEVFAYGEYIRAWNDNGDNMQGFYDYDRWRLTLGLMLTY